MPIDTCTISGLAYNELGEPVPGITLKVVKVLKSGTIIELKPRTVATSNDDGEFEAELGTPDFWLPRNCTAWLKGKFYIGATNFSQADGVAVAIPDAATATLEGLGSGVSVPSQGVTVKSDGVALAHPIATLDFSDAFSITESPTGTALLDVVGVSGFAPLASPAFTGAPTAPTAPAATNTTQLATTAFVRTEVANLVSAAPGTLDTLDELAAALGDDPNFSATLASSLALKAPLISPSFTTPAIGVASGTSLALTGAIQTGVGGTVAGTVELTEGTAPSLTPNAIKRYAPVDVAAGGIAIVELGAAATGFPLLTNSAGVMTTSVVGSTGTGNVVREGSPTFTGTVSGITSTMVGLGNADNTSDVNKPVSTAQQTALNLKANLISPSLTTPALGVATATSLASAKVIAPSDSTTAITFYKADGTTPIGVWDSTNLRLRVGSGVAPTATLDVTGAILSSSSITTGNGSSLNFGAGRSNFYGGADGTSIIGGNGGLTGLRSFVLGTTPPSTIGAAPVNGQTFSILQCMELLTIAAAATTTTTMQVPVGAIVLAVSVRVTTVIPTAASFTVKIGAQVFNTAAVSTAATSTDPGTAGGAFYNGTLQGVVITPNLTPGAATGVVRITVVYLMVTPPTN